MLILAASVFSGRFPVIFFFPACCGTCLLLLECGWVFSGPPSLKAAGLPNNHSPPQKPTKQCVASGPGKKELKFRAETDKIHKFENAVCPNPF